jgi:hypothetical protein
MLLSTRPWPSASSARDGEQRQAGGTEVGREPGRTHSGYRPDLFQSGESTAMKEQPDHAAIRPGKG